MFGGGGALAGSRDCEMPLLLLAPASGGGPGGTIVPSEGFDFYGNSAYNDSSGIVAAKNVAPRLSANYLESRKRQITIVVNSGNCLQ